MKFVAYENSKVRDKAVLCKTRRRAHSLVFIQARDHISKTTEFNSLTYGQIV